MRKQDLRLKYRNMRKSMSDHRICRYSVDIANRLLKLPIWNESVYHLFLTIQREREVDTMPILSLLQGKDKTVVLPKCDFQNRSMKHFLLTDDTKLKVSNYGITEPVSGVEISPRQVDVVFVPLLAYDKRGYRVGYGGGFYDRFLGECRSDVIKIGLSFFPPEKTIQGIEETDETMNKVVTPHKVYVTSYKDLI